jgi:pyruvate formate lyase activating enzyme
MNRRLFVRNSLGALSLFGIETLFGRGSYNNKSIVLYQEKYTIEALFYKVTPRGIKCNLCPHNCNVTDIRPGSCRTKIVRNNKLISTAYGNPYYVKTSVPEVENLYHFLPGIKMLVIGTAGCNLSCQYCNVSNTSQKSPDEISFNALYPEQLVEMCLNKGIKAIAYGYTEPVAFYEYMLTTARIARSKGIKNIMISNGYLNDAPLREISKYLDAAVISIKAFSDASYQKIAGGSIFPVFETIKTLKSLNIWMELTHVIVPGWTDNFELIEKMAGWMKENNLQDTPFHFQRMEPKFRFSQMEQTPEEMMKKALSVANSKGLEYVYAKNFSEDTLCPSCRKTFIKRNETAVNLIIKSDRCGNCNTKISGIWSV